MSSNPSHPMNGPRPRPSSPHFPDRRQSYGGPPSRSNETSYRPDDFSSREGMREPPKGPKAHFGNARGGFIQRGRGGFFSRDRDPRDARDGLFHRREGERDWNRREPTDIRDRRTPPPNPDRSRSPHTNSFRDARDPTSRDADLSSRYGIGPRENFSSTALSTPDGLQSAPSFGRGGFRPRGRGDYSFRGGARNFDDREKFPRSRSRDRPWTRDLHEDRTRERNRDWEPERRDTEERRHGDEQDQDGDRRRDAGTFRSQSRNSNGSLPQPLTPSSGYLSTANSNHATSDRPNFKSGTSQDEIARFRHVNVPAGDVTSNVQNHPHNHHLTIQDQAQNAQHQSLNTRAVAAPETRPVDDSRATKPDPTTVAPKGPKASRQLSPQPPTNRRVDVYERPLPQSQYGGQDVSGSRFENQGPRNVPQAPSSVISSPPTSRFGINPRPTSTRFPQPPFVHPSHSPRPNERLSSQLSSRPTHGEPINLPSQNQPKQTGQQDTSDSRSITPTKTSGLASHQTSPIAAAPLGPKYNSTPVSIRQTSIPPVRPRAQAPALGASGHFHSYNTWINPNLRHSHQPHQPSILQTVPPTANRSTPPKRDHNGEVKYTPKSEKTLATYTDPTPSSPLIEAIQRSTKPSAPISDGLSDQKIDPLVEPKKSPSFEKDASPSTAVDGEQPVATDEVDKTKSADDPSDDDDDDGIDEDDLAKGNAAYEKELRDLEARRPPTPRHNKELLSLLEEVDILASAADDLANGVHVTEPTIEKKTYEKTETGLLSPEPEVIEVYPSQIHLPSDPHDVDQANEDSSDGSTDLGHLPYFSAGPPTPFSETVSAQDTIFQNTKSIMIDRLKAERLNVYQEHEGLRAEYKQLYKEWRMRKDELDQQNKASNESAIIDTSPALVESPNVASTPVFESRGRVARFASELDYQKVIQESKITAEADQAREKQLLEDQALVDMAKEAKIPDMLTPRAAVADKYRDTNHRLKSEWVLNAFSFEQPLDNFTPEEHKIFTEQYMQFPKRFGQIAKALLSRHYEECVLHYYLTKKEANYKAQLLKKINKKGKRARQAPQRAPRSNALMSNMGGRNQILNSTEADSPQVPVTDTGRPRRAAAPTFEKAVAEAEQTSATPSINRRGPNQNKSDANSNATPERPAKRARTTQPKEKTTRKKNAQLLAAAPAPVPIKEANAQVIKMKEPKAEEGPQGQPQIEDAQLLAQFQAGSALLNGPPQFSAFPEAWPTGVRAPDKVPITSQPVLLPPPPPPPQPLQYTPIPEPQSQPGQSQPQQQQQTKNVPQTSSYWSVPEQNEFPRLLEIHGTDWQQIANGLKNKTAVMVKNYYHRSVESGKFESWEGIAREADERIKHKRNMSNPSQPNVVSKRRFEPSPQAVAHRTLAPSTEMVEQAVELNQGPMTTFTQLSPNQVAQTPPQIAPIPLPATNSVPAPAQPPSIKASAPAVANSKSAHSSRSHRQSQVAIAASVEGIRDPRPILQAQSLASRHPEPQPEQSRIVTSQQQPQPQPQPVQQSPQKTQQPVRLGQHSHRSSVDLHDFTEATARLHSQRYEPPHQQMNLSGALPPSTPPHNSMAPHPFSSDGRQAGPVATDRVQVPSGMVKEPEKMPKSNMQPLMSESSPPMPQRRDSIGIPYNNPMLFPPPPLPPKPKIMSPPQERPSSVPNITPLQQPPAPPRPTPAPAKRSNIMSILNDDPPEPQPRRVAPESQPATPAPTAQAVIPVSAYQQQPHQTQMSYSRQEQTIDSHRMLQHQQPPPSHRQLFPGKMAQQMHPPEQHSEQPVQMREQPATNWPPSAPRPNYEQRHSYNSPQSNPFDQSLPRSVMQQQIMPTKPPSPMVPQSVVQRDSFAGLQSHPHSSRPQPGSNLGPAPSPYSQQTTNHSKLQPHPQQAQPPRAQPLYSHSPHQDTLNRQHQDPFHRHRDDPRAQHEAMRQQEYGRPESYHQANMMRDQEMRVAEHARSQQMLQQQQQESMRQQEVMRQNEMHQHEFRQREQLRNSEAAMRHKEPIRSQQQLHPHQQLQYRDLSRQDTRQEFLRNDLAIPRTFTPPAHFAPAGFGPPPPTQLPQHSQHPPPPPPSGQGQGQGQRGRGGYEDMR